MWQSTLILHVKMRKWYETKHLVYNKYDKYEININKYDINMRHVMKFTYYESKIKISNLITQLECMAIIICLRVS